MAGLRRGSAPKYKKFDKRTYTWRGSYSTKTEAKRAAADWRYEGDFAARTVKHRKHWHVYAIHRGSLGWWEGSDDEAFDAEVARIRKRNAGQSNRRCSC